MGCLPPADFTVNNAAEVRGVIHLADLRQLTVLVKFEQQRSGKATKYWTLDMYLKGARIPHLKPHPRHGLPQLICHPA